MTTPVLNGRSRVRSAYVLVIVTLLILEIGKLILFCLAPPAVLAGDSEGYWNLSRQVASGDVWMLRDAVAYRTPGYPWFLGLTRAVSESHALNFVVGIQYLFVWMTTLLVVVWTRQTTNNSWLAAAALFFCVVSSARPSHASILLTETTFTFLFTLTLMLMCSNEKELPLKKSVAVGFCWGLMWLIRPVAVAILPAWIVTCWLSRRSGLRLPLKSDLFSWSVTLVVMATMLSPWIVRNVLAFQRTSLTVFLGRELWLATFGPGQPSAVSLPDTEASKRLEKLILAQGDFSGWKGNWGRQSSIDGGRTQWTLRPMS